MRLMMDDGLGSYGLECIIIMWFDHGQTRSKLFTHVLLYECYDLGMTDVWNSCKVMSKYLQICTWVGFGKSTYVHWFGS